MLGTDGRGDHRGPDRSWSAPLRRVVARVVGQDATGTPTPHDDRDPGACVVDCAVYVDGVRRGGQPAYQEAYAVVQAASDGFLWLGLHDPTPTEMADVATVFKLDELAVEEVLTAETARRSSGTGR